MRIKSSCRAIAAFLITLSLLLSAAVSVSASESKSVTLGGMPFGVSFRAGELKIGGFDEIETESGIASPGRDAGLLENDIIEKVNEKEVKSALDVTNEVKASKGRAVSFQIKRGEERLSFQVTPAQMKKTGDLRLGLWLEEGCAGLGTVTYIEEETGKFGGLGHGIQRGDEGALAEIGRGVVSEVEIVGVERGVSGDPGELKGSFSPSRLGVVTKNTEVGVFGVLTALPSGCAEKSIKIAERDEVKSGGASVFCTVDGGGVCEYAVKITLSPEKEGEEKNFLITVTDKALIEKTGGIVRGMSGSPVVQNGKLIGAVTHVLVDDPCRGYGIFIENMMEAAE